MVVDMIEQSLNDKLVITRCVDLGGEFVDSLLSGSFLIETVSRANTTFSSGGSESFEELIRHVISVFKLLLSEPTNNKFFILEVFFTFGCGRYLQCS